ncbi:MAG: response regulator [Myxococcales bacterium]|nr:response regulator [Myxococcales bacterium]
MKAPRIPENEAERLKALESYRVMDTPPESSFDDLTTLVARILDVPIALVSLVDADRQWFKSRYGLEAPETPRDISFCGHVVAEQELLVVPDAFADNRFRDNPLVTGDPRVRFYAGVPLTTPDGHVLGTLCAIDHEARQVSARQLDTLSILGRQVADQLELRRQLRLTTDYEQRLRTLFETAVDAIITIDEAGVIDGVNSVVKRLLGYEPSELVGQHVGVLMPTRHRERLEQYLQHYPDDPGAKLIAATQEAIAVRKNGTELPIEISVSEMRLGDRRMFTGIVRDIAERKRVDQLKSEFVSTVSHELRTPLTSIRGALGLVAGGRVGKISNEAQEMVNIALNNSGRLVRLINDILDVEKIQSGKLDFEIQRLDLSGVIKDAIAANDGYALEHDSRIVLVSEPEPVLVYADSDRLAQVFANLISNAVKFSPAGEAVDIRTQVTADRVRVDVRDRGPGVPEKFQNRLFQRFAQADASDSRQNTGTGLGLSISKAIVERMSGTIGYQPAEGGGSRFYFELPIANAIVREAPVGASRVLVCEDEPDIALLLRKILAIEGYVVDVAPDIATATTLLGENDYAAVTLDLRLGEENGLDLLERIRHKAGSIPVVVVSAIADEVSRELNGGALSVVDWITKPIDETRLLASIQSATQAPGRTRLLYVEDDADLSEMVSALLSDIGPLTNVRTLREARKRLEEESYDLILLDMGLPDGDGTELLPFVGTTPVIVFSAREAESATGENIVAALVKSRVTEQTLREAIHRVLPVAS